MATDDAAPVGAAGTAAGASYIVVWLVPESPTDGTTFSTYLNDLSLHAIDASTGQTVSDQVVASALSVLPWPPGSGSYLTFASETTSADTDYNKAGQSYDYGKTLVIDDLDGISDDSFVVSADQKAIPASSKLTVTDAKAGKVTFSGSLPNFVPAETPISFIGQPLTSVTLDEAAGDAIFQCKPSSGTGKTLTFTSGETRGIPVGAHLGPIEGLVASGIKVTETHKTTLGLSTALIKDLPAQQQLTFRYQLSSGIVQHTETLLPTVWNFFTGPYAAVVPAAAATAVLTLIPNADLPDYLNVKIVADRGPQAIPDSTVYRNVQRTAGDPPAPAQYQAIPATDTSLYLAIPPPPKNSAMLLDIPSDGTPPPFAALLKAVNNALTADPKAGVDLATLVNSSADCQRIAYDTTWSYQHDLPPLPDPLESLHTNPPNPGGGGTSTTSSGSSESNNYEMDRQKFEGTLNSFYSTRNANAERLTKFVAAASAAVACEQLSHSATTALIEFPVDPSASLATAVQSEIMLTGLGVGPSGLDFAVSPERWNRTGLGRW